jgi:aspartate aminotransferase
MQLSERIQGIKTSATLALALKIAALKAAGKSVVPLGLGEPDFDTPIHIKKAAVAAIDAGFTKYTAIDGILELRQAVIAKFAEDNGLKYELNQIIVSSGSKQCFYNMAQALLNIGDEVIVPAPYWVSYPDMILLAGGKPVFLNTNIQQQFKITAKQLEAAITTKTRLFVLNSPSNPSGMAYTRQELAEIAAVLLKHPQIIIASDDIYEHIYWGTEPYTNILNVCPELYDRTIILHGVSKTYAMTGWRIGFAAGPEQLIHAMGIIQGQSTSGACSISQKAALAALTGDQNCVKEMCVAFKERQDYLVGALNDIPGIECLANQGTFYAFPNVEGIIARLQKQGKPIHTDAELANWLFDEAAVALTAGSAFGTPGHLRMSYATSLDNLHEAVRRFRALLV